MADVYEIPLSASAETFSVTLDGTEYRFTTTYADATEGAWLLDIADASDNALVSGVPLVTGADLLGQYRHLGFTGSLVCYGLGDETESAPDADNLGDAVKLYFVKD